MYNLPIYYLIYLYDLAILSMVFLNAQKYSDKVISSCITKIYRSFAHWKNNIYEIPLRMFI